MSHGWLIWLMHYFFMGCQVIKRILIFICLLFILSCEEVVIEQDNPLDDNNPDYTPPTIDFIVSPDDGSVLTTSDVVFEWEGNELVTEYRQKFNEQAWGDWSDQTSVVLQYLDEGDYSFAIQGRYESGDTSSVLVLNFTVNAVSGPALIFFPRANITSVGSNVTFQVMAEEVTNLTAAQFNISFDPSKLEILSVTQGAMLQISGESIFDVDYDNATGSVSVITAALGGSQPAVDGTGVLLELELKVNGAGTSTLEFDGTELFRDPDNNDITIAQKVNGIVKTE